jgi:TolB-like protein/AraC-like DNA-binding protein
MHNEFIQKLTNIVDANLASEKYGPEELAREMGMSYSSLNRKLKSVSNQTISQFIREYRLKKAKELLQNEDLTAAEISYRVGFGSPTYFNNCFREYFGVTPGELRNRPSGNETEEQPIEYIPKKPKRKKILAGMVISFVFLFPTTFFLIQNISSSKAEFAQEKSIALLPFKYLSDEPGKQYLADGMMDAILLNLSKIKNLRVISRTSVEQYRKTDKTSKTIGQELNVEYVLEGSFLKEGDKVRLILQLIKTSDDGHAWANEYDRQWKDIFSVQSEVSETIARELDAVITPEERLLIRKKPTNNLTAYDFYQRGKVELDKYLFGTNKRTQALKNALHLFHKALELDSTFSLAYTGLANAQFYSTSWRAYFSENYMDTVLMYANKALTYDPKCAEAYYYRAQAYSASSKIPEAFEEIDKALTYNPNDWRSFCLRSSLYSTIHDYVSGISNMYEGVLRNRGAGLPGFLRQFSDKLANLGYTDLGRKYIQQALELDGDSLRYLTSLASMEYFDRHFEKAYQLSKIVYLRDSTLNNDKGLYGKITGRYEEGISQDIKQAEQMIKSGDLNFCWNDIAYYYWKKGKMKEAKFYINEQIKACQKSINLGRGNAMLRGDHFDLAEAYALAGDKEKAYYYLDEVNKNRAFPLWWVILFERIPYFINMRQEPRFQNILKDVETKYQAEHIRVGKWLKVRELL